MSFKDMLILNQKKRKKMIMKLPSLFFKSPDKSTWPPWPSCRHPRTLSFRTNAAAAAATDSSVDSFFTLSSESSGSLSTASEISGSSSDPIERMIRGLRSSERLLFEPAGKSSSIVKENVLEKGAAVVAMDSDDPFRDFRKSMAEMVEAHGMEDLEEGLLSWYLRVNATNNHGFIIAAFVDLLLTLAMPPHSLSSSSSPMEIEDITSLLQHHHHHHVFS